MGFLKIQFAGIYQKNLKGDPMETKKFKKGRIVPKKIPSENTKRGSYVFEVVDVDVFVLDEVLAFRVCFGRP